MERPVGAVFIAASADGFIAPVDGSLGWLDAMQVPGEDYGYAAFFASVDTLVLGRSTWDTVAGFDAWPYEGKRVVVMTHRPLPARHGERAFAGDPRELVAQLGREGAKRLYVDGGQTIGAFLQARLIDELIVSVVPVLLGRGRRLFPEEGVPQKLTLVKSRSFPTGLVQLEWRVGG